MSPRAQLAGIPRLQEIEFLAIAAERVAVGATYNDIRKALIDYMSTERERTQPSGNHAALRLARHDEHRYMNNATDSLAELMRLGFVEQAHLPTTRKAAPFYANRQFELTNEGRIWLGQVGSDRRGAYDALLRVLWVTHPQLSGLLRLLRDGTFTIPTANWGEVHRVQHVGPEGRDAYIRFLASRAARAVQSGVAGWHADEQEISQALNTYTRERMAIDEKRRRPDRYLRNRDFVGGCEEAIVSFAFSRAGVRIDFTTLEVLRRWLKHLGVANFSYHVPAPPAFRIWGTADLIEDHHGKLTEIRRRTVGAWGDRVIEELPPAFELARTRNPEGDSFVPIYQVRAAVCSKLGISDTVFDAAITEFIAGERQRRAPFRISSDSAEHRVTPPTETPLRVHDRTGREQIIRVMTLIPR